MYGFRDKQRTLVNTVGIPGDAGSSPSKSRGGMPKYDPTTKLITLHRSPKTSLWDFCGLNLHTNTVYRKEIMKYKGKVPVNKKDSLLGRATKIVEEFPAGEEEYPGNLLPANMNTN
jgi:hypothetical protein